MVTLETAIFFISLSDNHLVNNVNRKRDLSLVREIVLSC